jgi:hypothetical protein
MAQWETDGVPSAQRIICDALAAAEERVEALMRDGEADLRLSHRAGNLEGLDVALQDLLRAIRAAAAELELPLHERSGRWRIGATLSAVWSDLQHLSPDHLERTQDSRDMPEQWRRVHAELMDATQRTIAALDHLPEQDSPD